MTTIIDIELTDGRKISGTADFGKGSPANPMSDAELACKFHECAAWGKLPRARADRIVDLVFGLEKVNNIRELTRLLQTGTGAGKTKRAPNRKRRVGRKKESAKKR
jgi:hypothetical protein